MLVFAWYSLLPFLQFLNGDWTKIFFPEIVAKSKPDSGLKPDVSRAGFLTYYAIVLCLSLDW